MVLCSNAIQHACSILVMEIYNPGDTSNTPGSNIQMLLKALSTWTRCVRLGVEFNSAGWKISRTRIGQPCPRATPFSSLSLLIMKMLKGISKVFLEAMSPKNQFRLFKEPINTDHFCKWDMWSKGTVLKFKECPLNEVLHQLKTNQHLGIFIFQLVKMCNGEEPFKV